MHNSAIISERERERETERQRETERDRERERQRERERERLDLFSIHNRFRMQIDVDSIPVLTNFKTIHLQVHVQVTLRQYNMIPHSRKLSREETFADWWLRSDHFTETTFGEC